MFTCSLLCWLQLFHDSNCETMLGAKKACGIHELRQILVNLREKSELPRHLIHGLSLNVAF